MAGLRKVDVRDSLLRTLGIQSTDTPSADMLADVLAAMNFAQQTLWTAGPDYFTRAQIAVTLVAGTAAYDLADTVQAVLGPFRITDSGRTLRALTSRGELDNFGFLYLGQTTAVIAAGEPLAYWIEGLAQVSGDAGKLKLHVVPAPNAANAGAAVLEGVSECTTYVTADLSATSVLSVAQQYVETLFLPLARKAITRSAYFSAKQLQEGIDADYDQALAMLLRAGGFPPAEGRKEAREVEA